MGESILCFIGHLSGFAAAGRPARAPAAAAKPTGLQQQHQPPWQGCRMAAAVRSEVAREALHGAEEQH